MKSFMYSSPDTMIREQDAGMREEDEKHKIKIETPEEKRQLWRPAYKR
jgi:hypothetical protein